MKLSIEDIRQQYQHNLFYYGDAIIYVVEIATKNRIMIQDISTSKLKYVPFDMKKFKPVLDRLGYCNTGTFAFFIKRVSVRQYGISLNRRNIRWLHKDEIFSNEEFDIAHRAVSTVNHPFIEITLRGEYPTFKEAAQAVKEGKAKSVAFDRQFSLDHRGRVYYRGSYCGSHNFEEITMEKGKEHLIKVIRDDAL